VEAGGQLDADVDRHLGGCLRRFRSVGSRSDAGGEGVH